MATSLLIAAINILAMKCIMVFFIVFLLVFGTLFLFSPAALAKMNQWGNKVIFQPKDSVERSSFMGILMLLLGIVMLIILLMLKSKTGT